MNKIFKILFCLAIFFFAISLVGCTKKNSSETDPPVVDPDPDPNPNPDPEPEPDPIVITLGENQTQLLVGEAVELQFTSNATSECELSITSSDETVVNVNDKKITGLKAGTSKITISYSIKGSLLDSKELNIEVLEEKVDVLLTTPYILISPSQLILAEAFSSKYLDLEYSVDNDLASIENNILSINSDKAGYVTITASAQRNNLKLSNSVTIFVLDKEELLLSVSTMKDEFELSEEYDVTATSLLNDDEAIIESSDDDIIKYENGKLIATGVGEAIISIFSASTNITIEYPVTVTYDWPTDTVDLEGVYLGLQNFGEITNSQMANFQYRFSIGGKVDTYSMIKVGTWELQNILEEGNIYHLTIANGTITNLVKCDDQETFAFTKKTSLVEGTVQAITPYSITINDAVYNLLESTGKYEINKYAGGARVVNRTIKVKDNVILSLTKNGYVQNIYKSKATPSYTPPVTAVPGERTLTNFFRTALSAVGHALYVYGGAWNFEDDGSSVQARTIGVADSWVEFFYEQDAYYSYRDNNNHAETYYPFGSFNEYYYAGVDCSGFVGWVIYNILNTENGQPGYVQGSTKMAKTFASLGMGTYTRNFSQPSASSHDFHVGDIMSTDGHVWICLGECSDHSLVIIHSTPSESIYGYSGGGAQIGAIGSNENCEAYKLADAYNKKYYPDWSSRYHTSLKSYSAYTKITNANAGKFTWNLDTTGVLDPDGLATKSPAEIFKIVFNED